MPQQTYSLQLTFQYSNGTKESFLVVISAESTNPYPELRQAVKERTSQPWCSLQTADETIYINMANVDSICVKPTIGEDEEDIGFSECERVTALNRAGRVL